MEVALDLEDLQKACDALVAAVRSSVELDVRSIASIKEGVSRLKASQDATRENVEKLRALFRGA